MRQPMIGKGEARLSFAALRVWVLLLLGMMLAIIPIGWMGAPRAQSDQPFGMTHYPRVNAITISQIEDATIVSIRLDQSLPYQFFALGVPSPRLVIDLPRVTWAMGNGKAGTLSGTGGVKQLRFADKSLKESRIVLDLNGPMRIRKHEITGVFGGRQLRLELVPTSTATFLAAAPQPSPKAKVKTKDNAKDDASAQVLPLGVHSGPAQQGSSQSGRRFVIVIDPGHGGKDPGALGVSGTLQEKQVTLASARILAEYLNRDRRFVVILTRDSDVFLTLERRITIARDKRADLFISLHADSAPAGSRAVGATVYTLSEAGGQRARQLLNQENWSITPSTQIKDKSVTEILRDLTQRDTKNQSAIFGQNLIQEIQKIGPVTGTSHRRAGFFVLLSPRVPAVLLEMGFMSHPEDEARLNNLQFRSRQMAATAKTISAYFDRVQIMSGAGGKN
ncbi:N-acetylmuramoyl-L-alanine amidase [Candidatus Phycosocius spiralis]|uniref:N-acetylmuramoyl-L-alanine amidase n=1 Tax=Candidatus Phycosocius spiralis TaxID=2815099 RepID=A0ABQ4PXU3_9PROT|nr:N-acetylmuramoyl-L-alanine amidase [Candidatus Phycosocius spiralis]GIU67867.1 N-acetylmuramoyl-L-alanine amidase [Candidatus Phycosocius spiralis]